LILGGALICFGLLIHAHADGYMGIWGNGEMKWILLLFIFIYFSFILFYVFVSLGREGENGFTYVVMWAKNHMI